MRFFKAIKSTLSGIWEAQKLSLIEPLRRRKTGYDYALMFVIFGDLLGYPFQSTYYSRLFLIHWLPRIETWKKRLLKERDVLDKISD